MAREETVSLPDVEVARRDDWALWCRVKGRLVPIPMQLVHAPRPLPLAGERITLVVPKWFAVDHGLV